MIEIEHIFIALASPLFVFCFVMEKEERRHLLSLLAGFGAALLAGYINSCFTMLFQMTGSEAVQNLTPIVEELLKMFPVLFFAEAFAQNRKQVITVAVEIGLGFAVLENCSYLVTYGSESLLFSIVRGLATGVLHPLCTMIAGIGVCLLYKRKKFATVSFFGFLCTAIMVHGTFNLLIEAEERGYRFWGCLIPLLLTGICILCYKIYRKRNLKQEPE